MVTAWAYRTEARQIKQSEPWLAGSLAAAAVGGRMLVTGPN